MAKLTAHGDEIARYFSPRRRALVSVRSDGVSLIRRVGTGWKVLARKKAEIPLDEWRTRKLEAIAALPTWARECRALPSWHTLESAVTDGVCESVTGDNVEPDGHGPDGAPSWLLALGMI